MNRMLSPTKLLRHKAVRWKQPQTPLLDFLSLSFVSLLDFRLVLHPDISPNAVGINIHKLRFATSDGPCLRTRTAPSTATMLRASTTLKQVYSRHFISYVKCGTRTHDLKFSRLLLDQLSYRSIWRRYSDLN